MTCFFAWAFALLFLPVLVLLWATEDRHQRAKRWRKAGATYQSIGDRLGVSKSTARRWCIA